MVKSKTFKCPSMDIIFICHQEKWDLKRFVPSNNAYRLNPWCFRFGSIYQSIKERTFLLYLKPPSLWKEVFPFYCISLLLSVSLSLNYFYTASKNLCCVCNWSYKSDFSYFLAFIFPRKMRIFFDNVLAVIYVPKLKDNTRQTMRPFSCFSFGNIM